MKITDIAIDRPVFTTMVMVGLMTLGLMSVSRLGLDLFPDVSFPVVAISTVYPGASPIEVEDKVSRKLEEAVAGLAGIESLSSTSRDSLSTVVIQFDLETDVHQASADVRAKVAAIRGTLPSDVKDPIVDRFDPSAIPVITYAIAGQGDPVALRKLAEDVVGPAMERVEGVASVRITGGLEREVLVDIDAAALQAEGLTLPTVAQAIRTQAVALPAGRITVAQTERGVKASGQLERIDALRQLPILTRPDGFVLTLGAVATVRDAVAEQRTLTRVNGEGSVALEVIKQAGGNTVEVVDRVTIATDKLLKELPKGVTIRPVVDTSLYVRTNVDNLWHHLIVGGLMAIFVIFIFMLDWRSTLISSLALPTSIVATFFVMWQFGFTLNIMSMMGLTLSVGILIDDAVVVRENIFRHMENGSDRVTAAREGTREIAMAVLATTLTIVAVFVPVAFTGGMIGSFFREFGITVAAAVVISLLVSFTLDPMLSARVAREVSPDHQEKLRKVPVAGHILRFYDALDRGYHSVLQWVLGHRVVTMVGAVAILFGSCSLVPYLGQEFAGRGDRGEFEVHVEYDAATPLAQTSDRVAKLERTLAEFPSLRQITTTVGVDEQSHKATMRVELTKATEREQSVGDFMENVRKKFSSVPGLKFRMREAGMGDSSMEQAPVTIHIRGPELEGLGRVGNQVVALLRETAGIRDAEVDYSPGAIEARLEPDRAKMADAKVSFLTVADTLRSALNGVEVAKLQPPDDEDVPVRLRVAPSQAATLAAIEDLEVMASDGRLVTVGDVVSRTSQPAPASIGRKDRQRMVTVTANVYGRSLGEVIADVENKLANADIPTGYSVDFGGEAEQMKDTFANLALAMAMAILFIYLVLASQFESFIHPLTIMFALPLAAVGALLALFLVNQPFGMAAMIGIILLMGLATKNSILLVDYANQLRRERGMSITEALLEACPTRLRPILMTSAAVILGMLPSAMATGEGSEFQAPMSVAVIGGVISSTLLTLVVVPVAYTWLDWFTLAGRAERRAKRAGASEPATTTARDAT